MGLHLTVCEWCGMSCSRVTISGFQNALLEVVEKQRPDSANDGQQTHGWKVKRAAILTHSPVCRFLQARHFGFRTNATKYEGGGAVRRGFDWSDACTSTVIAAVAQLSQGHRDLLITAVSRADA